MSNPDTSPATPPTSTGELPARTLGERFWAKVREDHMRVAAMQYEFYKPYLEGRVLDYGCGDGSFLEYLRRHTELDVLGVDVAHNSWYDIPVLLYGGERIPLEDGSVDCSVANFVLHHTPDPEAALADMLRVTGKRVVLLEDLWFNNWQKFVLFFMHYLFDAFMIVLSWFSSFGWKTDWDYKFRTDEEWKAIFERLGAKLVHEEVVKTDYPVPHKIYVLEK